MHTISDASKAAGLAKHKAQLDHWATLPTRQAFADEAHMRGYLARAGVRIHSNLEPATVKRLRQQLRRGGVTGDTFLGVNAHGRCIGLEGYLDRNPGLPLWAATALCLELAA